MIIRGAIVIFRETPEVYCGYPRNARFVLRWSGSHCEKALCDCMCYQFKVGTQGWNCNWQFKVGAQCWNSRFWNCNLTIQGWSSLEFWLAMQRWNFDWQLSFWFKCCLLIRCRHYAIAPRIAKHQWCIERLLNAVNLQNGFMDCFYFLHLYRCHHCQ